MDGALLSRDAAVIAAIFGLAAMAWFGWAQEAPPRRWRIPLAVGGVAGVLVAVLGVVLAIRHWGPETALATADARRTFGIICGIEFGLAGLGAAVLGITKRSEWIACWIALVVGAHFVPLAFLFNDPGLVVLAVVMVVGAVLPVVLRSRSAITPSAVTGLVSGLALLVFAIRSALLV